MFYALQISYRQEQVEIWLTALEGRLSMGKLVLLTQIVVSLGFRCMMASLRSAIHAHHCTLSHTNRAVSLSSLQHCVWSPSQAVNALFVNCHLELTVHKLLPLAIYKVGVRVCT